MIKISLQKENVFIMMQTQYEMQEFPNPEKVTVLDVLKKVHMQLFQVEEEELSKYLCVEDGVITRVLGEETSLVGFVINGEVPNDHKPDWKGVCLLYTAEQSIVQSGDWIEFYFYQDPYAMDLFTWFQHRNERIRELCLKAGESIRLTLRGVSMAWYGSCMPDVLHKNIKNVDQAQIGYLNHHGEIIPLDQLITDEQGEFELKISEEGVYHLSAYRGARGLIVSPYLSIHVEGS